jgi:hypothetical protein
MGAKVVELFINNEPEFPGRATRILADLPGQNVHGSSIGMQLLGKSEIMASGIEL